MKERLKCIFLTALILLVFGAVFAAIFHIERADAARRTNAMEFYEHVGHRSCADWDQKTLTAEATATERTDCLIVESCVGSIHSIDTGASAPVLFCTIGSNSATVTMHVDVPGGTASGSTVVNWTVFGYGRRN